MSEAKNGFPIHDLESAPDKAKPVLEQVQKRYGFIPSLMGIFAESPPTLKAYLELQGNIGTGALTPLEQQVVMITVSVLHDCRFCVAAHSTASLKNNLDADVIAALRDDTPIADAKLETLRQFTKQVVAERGWVADTDVQTVLDAGYSHAQVLEVILGVTIKTLSNYVNHIAGTPVDEAFQGQAWDGPKQRAAE